MTNVLIPDQEIWADVPGFDGFYKISTLGRVKSMARPNYRKLISGYVMIKPRIMKLTYTVDGYRQVQLHKNGSKKTISIHRTVFFTFNPHIQKLPGYEVDHINNDKNDCRLHNLQYIKNRHNSSKRSINRRKSSRFTGVSWSQERGKWQAHIRHNSKSYYLGRYSTEIEAHQAYTKALLEIEQGVFSKQVRKPTSKYKGVCRHKASGKWMVKHRGEYLGLFQNEKDAHISYQKADEIK